MKTYRNLLLATLAMTFALIVLGAYVRLSDAGLGCPDWPGCYGHATVTQASDHISAAQEADPHGPVTFAKAWKEMIHRYIAGIVGLCIVGIAALAWRNRRDPAASPWLATALIGVVGLQAMFGKWTVTMLLKPAIVTGHLIGGLTVLALLVCLYARTLAPARVTVSPALRLFAMSAFVVLAAQITLGGWVSTNYAALACSDLPTCRGAWVPEMDIANGFHVIRELGVGADGETLTIEALTAIHWMHRVGAVIATLVLVSLAFGLRRAGHAALSTALLVILVLQVLLGLANVWFSLPLALAAAHNGGAAALVIVMVLINYRLRATAQQRYPGVLHESHAA
ncbi:heme A synthase [Methyloversatilis sp.]|uniref:COX15/CtaA family protein n=1 Tax=Methyloversatilis sp. TaxID=2569862 RepID=UPI002733B717|nr:COX15/CtaA family protein [Methyloversatilis sp.]MDP2868833.1 COX15/CtaA family protein [Methyloversatilis sp.]MDP3289496.1 COX15/CtaA family protein [Methyloversatilis sp.]MDP3457506.1 COX15/CtaA family protein [Methyloversatilis sp.]MDP3579882.1 COX15/CtaA family protein [Methyloversatilis sp.]